jgi:hypothetical protein
MKFTMRNLGRLREATIDLGKDLILLAGPNNTSKTYVADSIYGLCKRSDALVREVVGARTDLDPVSYRFEIDLPAFVLQHVAAMLPAIADLYGRQLADVFATDDAFVSRASIELEAGEGEISELAGALLRVELQRELGGDGLFAILGRVTFDKRAGASATTITWVPALSADAGRDAKADQSYVSTLVRSFVSTLLAERLFCGGEQTYILPAERSAIQLFSRELSIKRNRIMDALARVSWRKGADVDKEIVELVSREARRYPLPISDSLRVAEDLAAVKKLTSEYAPLAEELERDLIEGAVEIDEDGDVGFRPVGSEARIELHLASSSVRSLAPLSLYLRHLARRGHFLIIDEPELNLHPDNQRRVARLLARLARSGIKVMLSTHSDYVIREINNLIMLSADAAGDLRRRYGYREDETLRPEQVGAYLFDAQAARAIPVKHTGIEVETIDREINRLNVTSQDIYFSLFENDRQ